MKEGCGLPCRQTGRLPPPLLVSQSLTPLPCTHCRPKCMHPSPQSRSLPHSPTLLQSLCSARSHLPSPAHFHTLPPCCNRSAPPAGLSIAPLTSTLSHSAAIALLHPQSSQLGGCPSMETFATLMELSIPLGKEAQVRACGEGAALRAWCPGSFVQGDACHACGAQQPPLALGVYSTPKLALSSPRV